MPTESPRPPRARRQVQAPDNPQHAVEHAVAAALAARVAPDARAVPIALALSGGMDSMVLLDALSNARDARTLLFAVHVHHGLSPNADRWAEFCAEQCAARDVALTVCRVQVDRRPGTSLEEEARRGRYQQLFAAKADIVAMAHHADDQAETVLLQLLRGAGVAGLAAMAPFHAADGARPALLRPLLALPRAKLLAYAQARALTWIDDESNADGRYRRNRLRNEVAPLLATYFPGYPDTLVRAASHQAEASALLDELAALDAIGALTEMGEMRSETRSETRSEMSSVRMSAPDGDGALDCGRLIALPPARARNLLRWFLRRAGLRPPSTAQLADMLRQLQQVTNDTHLSFDHDGAQIGYHRGTLLIHAATVPELYDYPWTGEDTLQLPGGVMRFVATRGSGIADRFVATASLRMRPRDGGERIQIAANRPRRAIKKLLQEARLPVWQRDALPLLWCGDEVAAVPGIGTAVRFQAHDDETGWHMTWHPEPTGHVRSAPIDKARHHGAKLDG